MDARRVSRTVIDPKVRHVGFVTSNAAPHPGRKQSGTAVAASPPLADSPSSNSLSPVMIPPPRHLSDLASRTAAVPVPESAFRRHVAGDQVPVGSYNPSESLLGTSPVLSPSSRVGDGELEFSEESSAGWYRRSNSAKFASSFPGGGFETTMVKSSQNFAAKAGKAESESKKHVESEAKKHVEVPGN